MNPGCPNQDCLFYNKNDQVIKAGFYYRKDDSRHIKRFKCKHCLKKFSLATLSTAYLQKKRRVNHQVRNLLSSGVSMRRIAILLDIHRTTVERKLLYLAQVARTKQQNILAELKNQVTHLQFDDLITIEHTKLKPLTVTLAVDKIKRTILGAEVGTIPAFGHLSYKSVKKYGKRKCEHKATITKLFKAIQKTISSDALIESDKHHFYASKVKKFFPKATHQQYDGGRSCIAGQGELKKKHFDPLFTLNHSCAMLRANINRLIRKTWCTTKNPMRLKDHLDIYIEFHNSVLLGHT